MNAGHRGRGRPARETEVIAVLVKFEAPLAERLRRFVVRTGIKQREILHQALEDWLRRQHYPKGDPDAGGPPRREFRRLQAPGASSPPPVTPPAGTSGENPASQAPPVDLL